uniref:MULE transposase domain-containing protein n=1 Tax=Amphimedon queenslandica TaxID=400682 RepID=A0A1X7UZ56_AMPQE
MFIVKYAYLYTATPLKEGAPSFTLACIGNDNKFTFEEVMKQWQCIFSELKNRGIRVTSFSADGDSQSLKAMRVTCVFP